MSPCGPEEVEAPPFARNAAPPRRGPKMGMGPTAVKQNQLSGYLLRKFKNSNGWQRLWVIFTSFCLFFYKTHQEDAPLASLPLLGYTVSIPTNADPVNCRHVFKLHFKSHVYFFRADSEYTWKRWMEVIRRGVSSPGKIGHLAEDGSMVNFPL